jgi:hypothetical protein
LSRQSNTNVAWSGRRFLNPNSINWRQHRAAFGAQSAVVGSALKRG